MNRKFYNITKARKTDHDVLNFCFISIYLCKTKEPWIRVLLFTFYLFI